jgi:Polyketide cyclase / dehydrase and lipid transport
VSNDYHFITRWQARATPDEVADVLSDPCDLPRWWPAVYLDVRVIREGDVRGVGRVVELLSKGWLPYTIRWRFTTMRNDGARGISLRAEGDFVGTGTWVFKQDGEFVNAFYDWRISAEKPLLRRLTWLLRPAFAANHRWAMRTGEQSLRLELQRRRLAERDRSVLPSPPQGTFARLARAKRW